MRLILNATSDRFSFVAVSRSIIATSNKQITLGLTSVLQPYVGSDSARADIGLFQPGGSGPKLVGGGVSQLSCAMRRPPWTDGRRGFLLGCTRPVRTARAARCRQVLSKNTAPLFPGLLCRCLWTPCPGAPGNELLPSPSPPSPRFGAK